MKLSPFDLNLLVALDALIGTQSVTRAAEQLGLSKPAMSHALARLRTQLRDPILVRSGQRLALSDRAREAGPTVRELVNQARKVMSPQLAFDLPTLQREFKIAATDHAISLLAVGLGREMRRAAPNAGLRFLPILDDTVPALREGKEDLTLGVFPSLPGEFRIQRLFVERFVCVVRRNHPEVRKRLSLKQFLDLHHVCVAPRGRPGSPVDDALAARGLQRRITRYVPYFLAALDLVASSDCVVTLSERLAEAQKDRFELLVFKPPLPLEPYSIHQIWHPRSDAEPAHIWLRRLVARLARSL